MTSQTSHSIDGFSFFLILTATWLLVLSTGSVEARRPYSANHIHEPRGDLRLSKKTVPTGIIGVPSAEQIVSLLIRRGGYRAARKPGLRRRRQASWKDELADDSRVDLKDYNSNTGYRVEAFQEGQCYGAPWARKLTCIRHNFCCALRVSPLLENYGLGHEGHSLVRLYIPSATSLGNFKIKQQYMFEYSDVKAACLVFPKAIGV